MFFSRRYGRKLAETHLKHRFRGMTMGNRLSPMGLSEHTMSARCSCGWIGIAYPTSGDYRIDCVNDYVAHLAKMIDG